MLEAKTMTEIESFLGMEGGALKEAIESEDSKEIKMPTGEFINTETHQVFSNEQLTTREDSLKKTHEKAGAEMLVKKFKKDNDLEFDGKTLEHLRAFDKENILKEAGKEPDARILELETKNGKLITSNEEWESKHGLLVESNAKAGVKRDDDTDILGFMSGEYSIPKSDMLTIFNSKHSIDRPDGKRTISKGGEKMEDGKTFEPLGLQSVVEEFSKQYAKNPEGGNGGGNEGGDGGSGSLAVFEKRMKSQGHNKGSEAYMREYNKAINDKTLTF